jgi:hypothetical protein
LICFCFCFCLLSFCFCFFFFFSSLSFHLSFFISFWLSFLLSSLFSLSCFLLSFFPYLLLPHSPSSSLLLLSFFVLLSCSTLSFFLRLLSSSLLFVLLPFCVFLSTSFHCLRENTHHHLKELLNVLIVENRIEKFPLQSPALTYMKSKIRIKTTPLSATTKNTKHKTKQIKKRREDRVTFDCEETCSKHIFGNIKKSWRSHKHRGIGHHSLHGLSR